MNPTPNNQCPALLQKLENFNKAKQEADSLIDKFKKTGDKEIEQEIKQTIDKAREAKEALKQEARKTIAIPELGELNILEYLIMSRFWQDLPEEDKEKIKKESAAENVNQFLTSLAGKNSATLKNSRLAQLRIVRLQQEDESPEIQKQRTQAFSLIRYLTNLNTLNCDSNNLQSLAVENLTNLRRLYCSDNNLQSLAVENLTKLKELYCSNNNLQPLAVENLTNLRWLNCYNNKIPEQRVEQIEQWMKLKNVYGKVKPQKEETK